MENEQSIINIKTNERLTFRPDDVIENFSEEDNENSLESANEFIGDSKEKIEIKKRKQRKEERLRAAKEKAEQKALEIIRENEALKRENFELAEREREKTRAVLAREKDDLELRKEFSKIQLKIAAEKGDGEALADAQENLTNIGIGISRLEDAERQYERFDRVRNQDVPDSSNNFAFEDEDVSEELMEFAEKNPWIEDPELLEEAQEVERKLTKRLKLSGRSHLIGTRDFYDQIGYEVKSKYGLNDDGEENYFSPVAPATHSRVEDNYTPRMRGGLSREEREFARYMAPVLTKNGGAPVSDREAEEIFRKASTNIRVRR